LHPQILANEGLPELLIEHFRPHLEEVVRAGLAPPHLLFVHHALAYHFGFVTAPKGVSASSSNFLHFQPKGE